MAIHELKTWPDVFDSMRRGYKTADFRLDDRGFNVDDKLILKEFNPVNKKYSGREIRALVRHIVKGGQFGIPKDYVMMSVVLINKVSRGG